MVMTSSARHGFPVMHWQETYDAQIFSKQINGYHVSSMS